MKYSAEGLLQAKQNCKDSMGLGGLEINMCTYDLLTKSLFVDFHVFTYPWNIPSIPTCHAISCQF
jgi:hypothetical protein